MRGMHARTMSSHWTVTAAYPSLRSAARAIGVNASTLSRRADLTAAQLGQERKVPVSDVIRIAAEYQRRDLSQIAGELVLAAAKYGEEVQRAVGDEVDRALERYAPARAADPEAEAFVAEARRRLPADLAAQVAAAVNDRESAPAIPGSAVGWSPSED